MLSSQEEILFYLTPRPLKFDGCDSTVEFRNSTEHRKKLLRQFVHCVSPVVVVIKDRGANETSV